MGRAQRKGRGEMQASVSSATQNEMIKKISQKRSGIYFLQLVIIMGSASVPSKSDFNPVLVFGEERVRVRRALVFFAPFPSLFSRLTYRLSSTVLSLVAEAGL